jgi:hypothetical protein
MAIPRESRAGTARLAVGEGTQESRHLSAGKQ